ncbi:MAG: WD40 repeat domain-containing protein [Planctomycetaceae bacterium]
MLDPKQAHVLAQWKHDRPLVACRLEPQGRYVFSGAEDATVQRFALADGAKTVLSGGHETWVRAFGFSKDGNQVISGGSDGRLVWWETAAETPQPIRTLEAHQGWIRSMSVSPDGTLLATGGNDLVVRLWNVADGSLVRELPGHERHVYCVEFHPGGAFLLTGDLLGVLKQWDVKTGQVVRTFDAKPLHSYNGGQKVNFGGVRALAVSPDGKYLAAGGLHKASNPLGAVHEPLVLLFEWESQKLVRSHIAEGITQGVIWRLRYLSDGTLMGASGGGSGGWLIFWKADADKDVHRFQLPNTVRDMDLHADGLQVATAHHDRHVRMTRLAAKTA